MITANDVIKLWESFEEEEGEQSVANLGAIPNPAVGVVTIQHPNRIRRKFKKSKNPWGYGDYLDKEERQVSRASEFNKLFVEEDGKPVEKKMREESRADYEADVKRPGKFEGEAPWVPYFYNAYMDGFGDYVDEETQEFDVEAQDIAIFPELKGNSKVTLYFDSQGFVSGVAESHKKEIKMSRASEFNRMFNEQGDVIMPGATTSEEPVVVDTPAEEPKNDGPVDKGQILDRIKSAQMLLDGSFDTCISAIKKAKNDDDIRMALSVLKGAAVGVANGMQESRRIREASMCQNYVWVSNSCDSGCPVEDISPGDSCPYVPPQGHMKHQVECDCYAEFGESRKKS